MKEELKGSQHKLDKNRNGKLDAHDFKLLRKMKTEESDLEEESEMDEAYGRGFRGVGGARRREDDERHDLDPGYRKSSSYRSKYSKAAGAAGARSLSDLAADAKKKKEASMSEEYELEESFVVKDHQGKRAHVAYSEGEAKRKAEELTKKTGNKHSVVYTRSAVVAKEEYELDEAIKGWKHAHTDIAKSRAAASAAGKQVHLHVLTKAGKESGMNDARKSFDSVEAAQKYHDDLHKLNPGKKYKHNMYVDGKLEKVLGESVESGVTFSQFMTKLEEAKKCMNEKKEKDDEDDDGEEEERDPEDYEEKGEIKITKRADRKTDKLGRKRPQSLANYHTYGDKDDGDSKSMKEDYDLDEGVKSDEESKPSRKRSKNLEFHDGEDDGKGRITQEEVELDEELDEGTKPSQGSKPGWMLKADPELKKKVDAKIALAKARNKSHGDPKAGKSVKEGYSFKDLLNRLSK